MAIMQRLFQKEVLIYVIIMDISILALVGALVGQFVFDLPPCNLCIWQRIPFVLTIILGGIGIFIQQARGKALGLSGLSFLANSGIAFFHTGVEQQWWQETAGCKANFDFTDSSQSLMQKIVSAQASSCTEIPWQDPFLGLSMANYNVMLCGAMAIFCFAALGYKLQNSHNGKGDASVE